MTGAELSARIAIARPSLRIEAAIDAQPGEVVAIMGPSGAGKSSLLGAIAGLVRFDAGTVRIGDRVVATTEKPRRHLPPAQRGAVLLGQEPHLFPHLTARENVAFGPRAAGIPRQVARAEADEWLWRVGLPGSGGQKPRELSGGQQQRVAVARALATGPQLLLLDEPLTALDPETAAEIRAMLHDQLTVTRSTAVIVTHDAVDAAALASRLIILEAGRVTQRGDVRDVLSAPATRFAATVAGLNRLEGVADGGLWRAPGGGVDVLIAAEDEASRRAAGDEGAPLAAVFRPSAVRLVPAGESTWTGALRLAEAEAAVPGEWLARIVRIEQTPAGARIHTADPAVAVDVAPDEIVAGRLAPGMPVRLRVAPADVRLQHVGP
ncbi:ATP-binding cassette domain-containing protein [Microbacterium sp. LRZ72]|uniref:sulfate/molybdate ABC transporter ATP-binding protein n=1 Tax=Microbacterium sp. LRZ72 TaxID=2942481 RepID=UPI0029A1823B|nr:ATP-binding cassette domain-containing protein [Microbacterium sp. LRZ72]MDX2376854.1 ATP-binding cassette domain-containing protein [Microbacterium sp. LRZ72]